MISPDVAANEMSPQEEATGFVQSFSELALWVEDLDRSVAFYRDRLGFTVFDYTAGVNAFLQSGDVVLALFCPVIEGNTAIAQEYLKRYGGPRGSVYHVGFKIAPAHLDNFAEAIRSIGIPVQGPQNFAAGRRSFFMEDPDGHFIELTDR